MYKVKRFSQVRQKNYGLLGDLRHSGLKRSYKKYVGRARRSIGNKLGDKIEEFKDLGEELDRKIVGRIKDGSPIEVMNPKVSNKIIRDNARKNKTRVMKSNYNNSSFMVHSDEVTDDLLNNENIRSPRQIRKVKNAAKSNKSLIFLGNLHNKSVDTLAHEMGHAQNANSYNPLTRGIHNLSKDKSHLDSINDKGLYQMARHAVKNKALVKEESNASKNAIKMMKEAGASKDEIRQGEKNLKLYLDRYKADSKLDNAEVLYRTVQIPSIVKRRIE